MLRLLLATLVGALVAFAWGFLSWEMIGWHTPQSFDDPAAVSKALVENAPKQGVYILPETTPDGPDVEALTRGPFLYATIRPSKLDAPWSFSTSLAKSFAVNFFACLIIAICVMRIRARRFISRASIGITLGLFASISAILPHHVWFELSGTHLLAQFLDPLVAYSLAGIAIACIIKAPKTRRIFS
ncbi:MAG: hypothetical protein ACPG32_06285 [Akkermansiaceae bacterium]